MSLCSERSAMKTAIREAQKNVLLLGAGYVSAPVVDYLTRDSNISVTVGSFTYLTRNLLHSSQFIACATHIERHNYINNMYTIIVASKTNTNLGIILKIYYSFPTDVLQSPYVTLILL